MVLPLVLAFALRAARPKGGAPAWVFWAAVMGSSLAAAGNALLPAPGSIALQATPALAFVLRVDGMSRVFLLLAAVVWPLVMLYAVEYMAHEERRADFFFSYLLTQSAVHALALSGNLLTFFLFFEMMTAVTLPLVRFDNTAQARAATRKYHLYSSIGGAAVLVGIFCAAGLGVGGDFAAGPLAPAGSAGREPLARVVFFVMLMGFCVKGGLFPLHGWLPAAHPQAPAPASAVLSGIITKMGVLGAARVLYWVAGVRFLRSTWVQWTLLILSLATVLMGSLMAYREKGLKKRLAYSSVSQVSYVLLGLFSMTEAGLVGALLHVIFHSLIKNTLFMGAGAMIHATGKTQAEDFVGLGKKMPWTYAFFAVASLGLVGIPPTGGFVSKWYLAQGALDTGLPCGWIAPAALLVSAVLTAGYLFSVVIRGCFYAPGEGMESASEVTWRMLVPMGICCLLTVALGVFTRPLTGYLAALAASLIG